MTRVTAAFVGHLSCADEKGNECKNDYCIHNVFNPGELVPNLHFDKEGMKITCTSFRAAPPVSKPKGMC